MLVRKAFMLASVLWVLRSNARQKCEALWRELPDLLQVLGEKLKGNNLARLRPY